MSMIYGEPFAMIPEWLLDQPVSDRAVRLYAILHRYADREGRAFPGRAKIAARLDCSEKSVDRALEELRECGALATAPRFRDDGSRTTNDYWLKSSPVSPPLDTGDEGPLDTGDEAITKASIERKPEKTLSPTRVSLTAETVESLFEEFWKLYPRKTDKGGARKAFAKAAAKMTVLHPGDVAGVNTILNAASRFARDPNLPEPSFVPHASTWLNGERWNDGPLPARRRTGQAAREAGTLSAAQAFLAKRAPDAPKAIGQ